uniref:Transposase n=1 Tax=Streptomyces flaveolus TaxID=67297 RepID=D3UA04_9ACTN|nr:transposase [Streptomyces flaveolus]
MVVDRDILAHQLFTGVSRQHLACSVEELAEPWQAITPPRKPNKLALPQVHAAREEARHRHSSKRITVEHALTDHKRSKQLTRWTHR